MRTLLFVGFLALLATPITTAAQVEEAAAPGEEAVLSVIYGFYNALKTGDRAAAETFFHPEARLLSTTLQRGEPAGIGFQSVRHFVEQALKPPAGSWEHRFHQPVVQVWGPLAVVWTKYSFHDREQLRYCGSEGYQLMQTPDGWRIVAVANHFQQGDCAEFITAHTQ